MNGHRPIYGTIAEVLAGMLVRGKDKSFAIKRASESSLAGCTIVFTGVASIEAYMPHMLRFVERVKNPEVHPFSVNMQDCLHCIYEMMERRGIRALSVTYTEQNPVAQVWIFNGDQICREVGEMLAALGMPFDPRDLEAAPQPSAEGA